MTELILRSSNGWVSMQWPCGGITDGPSAQAAEDVGLRVPDPEGTVYVLLPKAQVTQLQTL